jgi:antitoxin component YwqK of YwqJK toxin-antitoxin module
MPGRARPFFSPRLGIGLVSALVAACLVQHPPPERQAPSAVHEMRRTAHPDGAPRREMRVLVWSDGRVERDGPEREFHPDGSLAAERAFEHDQPCGLWRTWYPDGTPRAEIDHGVPGARVALLNRFWHANGQLAAEGRALDGMREGPWSYWSASGTLERKGAYRAGKRDGPWTLYDERGAPSAEGHYALGERVGVWTLWDAQGVPHERNAAELGRDEASAQ